MAVTLEGTIQRFRADSADEKPISGVLEAGQDPVTIRVGSVLTERDTGDRYVFDGNSWQRQEQTIETLFAALMEINQDMLAALKVIQAATATMANNAWETDYPTGR